MAASMNTIFHGPLAYEKPKGLAALLVPVLCPPTDFIDMQKLFRGITRVFVSLSMVLVSLSFVIVPAWLWLIRHEMAVGHVGDTAIVAVGGLLLFFVADATNRAVVGAAAERRNSLVTAEVTRSLRIVQRHVSSAPPAGAAASSSGAAVAGHRGTAVAAQPLANGVVAASRSHAAAPSSSQHPLIRQVKQRIIRLEQLIFGNELTEADLSPDALHNRVTTLCTEVGVPFSGSGAQPTPAELDQQLQALEKALLGTPS